MAKRTCAKCGKEFEYEAKKGQPPKYCSDECKKAAAAERKAERAAKAAAA